MIRRSMQIIRWCATFDETVQHAHFGTDRICTEVYVASIPHWLATKEQPRKRCKQCRARLARALQP